MGNLFNNGPKLLKLIVRVRKNLAGTIILSKEINKGKGKFKGKH